MRAPFPYFGGKYRVADVVWRHLGAGVDHYMEPFFGSGAVLLARPGWNPSMTETVCDRDGYICNAWRAMQFNPGEVARWCDWPVNHADLMARKAELIRNEDVLLEGLVSDPQWHDPVLAGYWIWAASCWIGVGLTRPGGARPHIDHNGTGVHSKRPHISDKGMGVHSKGCADIRAWFRALSERLRYVRVVCGDWSRICGGNWQAGNWKSVGIFFDPPYSSEKRDKSIYHAESMTVATKVRDWCAGRGDRENHRIVLAGYEGEHNSLEDIGWKKLEWKANGGYANTARKNKGQNQNRMEERLWLSPHCLDLPGKRQGRIYGFFDDVQGENKIRLIPRRPRRKVLLEVGR